MSNVENKPKLMVSRAIKILSLICTVLVFCPSFLVSCSGQNMDINVMTVLFGVEKFGQKIIDPHPIMIIFLLIPVGIFWILFSKKIDDGKSAKIITIGGIVDLIIWIIFRYAVKESAETNYCEFKTTGWYFLNILSLIVIIALAILVVIKKLEMNTDLMNYIYGQDLKVSIDQVSKGVFNSEESNTGTVATQNATSTVNDIVGKIAKVPKGIIVGGAVVIAVLAIVIKISGNAARTIDLNKYIRIETSGYDGYGTASATIDWDEIQNKYGSKLSFTSKANKQFQMYGSLVKSYTPIEVLKECISVDLEKDEELSNGESIAYTWNIDEDLYNYVNCKIKNKEDKYIVSDLPDIEKFDPFEDVQLAFSGFDSNGTVMIDYTGNDLNSNYFECDNYEQLSNGDKVTVKLSETDPKLYADRFNKVPEKFEKEYTVAGLERYLSKLSELDDTSLEELKKQGIDVFNSQIAKTSDGDGEELQSLNYIGDYLLTSKRQSDSMYGYSNNTLCLVYKAKMHNTYVDDENSFDNVKDYYWFISFDDITLDDEGNIKVDMTNYNTPSRSFRIDSDIRVGWSSISWDYLGYETLDELYNDLVKSNMDMYNHEDNVNDK